MSNLVMVVDDSAMIRMQVARALKESGLEVLQARDGRDAWDKLSGGSRPALVICDVNMPRMNGIEFLEQIKGDGGYKDMPIIMLTTEGEPSLIRKARELGAKGWLVKPFQAELLLATVNKIVLRDP